jgi:hypothetical protein
MQAKTMRLLAVAFGTVTANNGSLTNLVFVGCNAFVRETLSISGGWGVNFGSNHCSFLAFKFDTIFLRRPVVIFWLWNNNNGKCSWETG